MKHAVVPREYKGLHYLLKQTKKFLDTTLRGATENIDFGNLFIMNEYAEVPFGTRILGRLQHGSAPLSIAKAYYNNNLQPTYVWNFETEKFFNNRGFKNFHTIGAPWIYLLALQRSMGLDNSITENKEIRPIEELWIYANHSNYMNDGFEDNLISFLDAASMSNALEKVVLLFWYDFIKIPPNTRLLYPSLKIITLGDRAKCSTANAHLYQLHGILTRTKSIVIDFPSTPFFYALSVGCDVVWLRNSNFQLGLEEAIKIGNLELINAMSKDIVRPSEFQQFIRDNLGLDHMKSPQEIRRLFHWNQKGLILIEALLVVFTSVFCGPMRYLKSLRFFTRRSTPLQSAKST